MDGEIVQCFLARAGVRVPIVITLCGLLSLDPAIAQNYTPYQPGRVLPPANRAGHVEIVQGPALEFARDDLAIIRWITNNPGGSDDHFAVIHYGTDPMKLSQTAKSHIQLNRDHPQTVFRVRVDGLTPQTTYYSPVGAAVYSWFRPPATALTNHPILQHCSLWNFMR
jgi:Purple acid Phosphatase, N-terminal domain